VPGLSILEEDEIAAIEPFLLKEVVEFKPEHLAGWPAISYDRPLAEASLKAREKVAVRVRRRLSVSIEPGQEKRSIQSSAGKWSGGTFKNVLLPLWVGTYQFHGKDYHLLVNGQTGKVAGAKPRDDVKVAMVALGALLPAGAVRAGDLLVVDKCRMNANSALQNPHLEGDSFTWESGPLGILLLHGFTATTAEVRPLAKLLHQDGYTVSGPLLPGFGTTPYGG
jgi:hypothetical protein